MSDTAFKETNPASAARLGGELRARRLSLGWGLPELSQSLRIRQAYLEAIEEGRMADLPGATYALGFVRAYASALGLNGEMIAGRFRAEAAETTMRPALSFPAPVPQRGVPAGALMLLALLILGGTYAGWYYVSEHQRTPAETVPPIPDRPSTASEKPTPSPQVATILPSAAPPAARPAAQVPPVQAPAKLGAPLEPPASAPVAAPAGATTPPAVVAAKPPVGAPNAADALPPPAPAAPAARMVVRATADAWVTVKQPAGAPLFNKLMHAGDSWPVPATPAGLTLTTGNAGGTAIDVDGVAIANLGGSGAVRRDLKLDADALKAGPLPPIAPHGRLRAAPAPSPAGAR